MVFKLKERFKGLRKYLMVSFNQIFKLITNQLNCFIQMKVLIRVTIQMDLLVNLDLIMDFIPVEQPNLKFY